MATTKNAVAKSPTAKKATKATVSKATTGTTKAASPKKTTAVAIKSIQKPFNKTTLVSFLANECETETKEMKKMFEALEQTMIASLNKKGLGEFTLPGLLKIVVQEVPAKKKRFGKDPFSGEERWFPAKPASVRVKVRPLKKLKDAAA